MPAPKYRQIMADLQAQIDDGRLVVDESLPTTAQLAERYGVSRYTVRQAVMLLLETGVLYGQRGSGVFVAPKRPKPH